MTPEQAAKAYGYLSAAYSGLRHDDESRDLWLTHLEELEYDAARRALRRVVKEHDRWPPVATVVGLVLAEGRRATDGFPPDNATPASPDTVQRCLAEARAALGAAMNHATEGERP